MKGTPFEWQDSLLLDGELLPWHALGKGLIENEFTPYRELVQLHLDTLKDDEVFHSLDIGKGYQTADRLILAGVFSEVLDRFAKPGDLSFKPFDILSVDGVTPTASAAEKFAAVNEDDVYIVDLENPEAWMKAYEFFEKVTVAKGMEGVVSKPLEGAMEPGTPPYMKVRAPDYLTLVYGYDYLLEDKYRALCQQKNISGKMKLAIKEHSLATEMLSADGERKYQIAVEMIGEMNKEAVLDPRL